MGDYAGYNTTGFQSPAQDYVEPVIDLAAMLDLRRPNIYPMRVVGQALASRGIHHGDVLVANAAADPKSGKMCVAIMNGEVVLATLRFKAGSWWLHPSSRPLNPWQRNRDLGDRGSARAIQGVMHAGADRLQQFLLLL